MNLEYLGFVAAAFTTGAFLPQAIKTIRTRETHSISLWMYITFTVGVLLWFSYGVALRSWPLILSNTVTFLLAATILVLKVRHG